MKLYEIAHSRAGDKGNTLTLSLIPYDEGDYPRLCQDLTEERVERHFEGVVHGKITRYLMPNIASLLFVCEDALLGGVTTSLGMDAHGKALSSLLLELEL